MAVLRAKLLEAEGESSLAKTNYEKLQEDHTE